MKVEKFTYHFELTPTLNFQKAAVGITVDCAMEDGDIYKEEIKRVMSEVRAEVGREALKMIEELDRQMQIAKNGA